jgi:hypothetical protein
MIAQQIIQGFKHIKKIRWSNEPKVRTLSLGETNM